MITIEPVVIPLWPEGTPNLRADATGEKLVDNHASNVHHPSITAYPVPTGSAGGTAVIICPGGGYRWLAMDTEGPTIAAWFNDLGVTAFVLKYRMAEYGYPAPLQDVLRAVRLVRRRAAEFGVKHERIGVMGFSAGGHVASTAATLFDAPEGRTGAELDATSARPDFAVLLYPVITMETPFAHPGSRSALIGETPLPELIARMSTDQQVTPRTPPTFIVHTTADHWVPVENSLAFYAALKRAGVPAELHVFEQGTHGFAMHPGQGPVSDWPNLLEDWLGMHGWIAPGNAAPRHISSRT